MTRIETMEELESLYGVAPATSIRKVANRLHPVYRGWIERSRFCVLTTVGPEGTDGSPRGDDGPVVTVLDDRTLALPDWHGNNRIDSLRNILRDARVSLMFMIPGSTNVIRVNGRAHLTAAPEMLKRFARGRHLPRTVTVIDIGEVYFQCARALMRSKLWTSGDESEGLPTAGEILAEMTEAEEGGADYDREWPERAKESLW